MGRWSSLVTVELRPGDGGGTLLRWTEQVSFAAPEGPDDLRHLSRAIRLRLDGLDAAAT